MQKSKSKAKASSKNNLTFHHILVLDSSGSMGICKSGVLAGFNHEVGNIRSLSQKTNKGERHLVSLVTFSDPDKIKFPIKAKPVETLEELTDESYQPNGNTALNDAIGMTLNYLKDWKKASHRKVDVIVTIMTDGMENWSRKFTQAQIKDLIEEVQSKHGFTITFVGAKQVEQTAVSLGVKLSNTLIFNGSNEETLSVFDKLGTARSAYVASKYMRSQVGGDLSQNVGCSTSNLFSDSETVTDVKNAK